MERKTIEQIIPRKERPTVYKIFFASRVKDFILHYSSMDKNRRGLDTALGEKGVGPTDDPEYPIKGRQGLSDWIAFNKSRLDMSEDAVNRRKEAVEVRKKLITDKMDANMSDRFYANIMGFHMAFSRKPVEGGKTDITINGKKVYVHRKLSGDRLMTYGDKIEVSEDAIKKVMDKAMAAKDSKWEEKVILEEVSESDLLIRKNKKKAKEESAEKETSQQSAEETASQEAPQTTEEDNAGKRKECDIQIDLDLRAGRNPVVINDKLSGDEVAVIPGGHLISKDIWEKGYDSMMEHKRSQWKETRPDGTTVELGYAVEVDGHPAFIDWEKGAKSVCSGGKEGSSISMEKWESLYTKMRNNGTKKYVETLSDGTIVTARLIMKVDEKNASIDASLGEDTVAKDVETVTQISREKWEEIKDRLTTSRDGKCSVTLPNGTRITGSFKMSVDGKEASVSRGMEGKDIEEGRDYCMMSEEKYESLMEKMEESEKCIFEETLENGKKLTVKRESELYLQTNGVEKNEEVTLHGEALDDAIVFASKMDTGTRQEMKEEFLGNLVGQSMLMGERYAVPIALTPVRSYINGYKQNKMNGSRNLGSLLSQLFSMLTHGQFIGR